MKKNIHPEWFPEATVSCACGNKFQTGSTQEAIRTEICSACHPFFTGQQQRLIDIEGQVDRFYRKLQARQDYVEEKSTREEAKVSPDRPLAELELGKRSLATLEKAGITLAGDVLEKLSTGDQAMLDIDGFGRKSLIDLKKELRKLGY